LTSAAEQIKPPKAANLSGYIQGQARFGIVNDCEGQLKIWKFGKNPLHIKKYIIIHKEQIHLAMIKICN
jgi:hypothetical protein